MAVFHPGFSERVFEFSFNAEFANAHRSVLAAAPYIPTQNEEKSLGYDVAFQLKHRGAIHSVALQHKVCRYVDALGTSNRNLWSASRGPYFAYRVDVDQFNLIAGVVAAKLPGIEFYYCAPLFSTLSELNSHYMNTTVATHVVWIDISLAGRISDSNAHTIVCSKDGSRSFLFSKKAQELGVVHPEQRKDDWGRESVLKLADLQNTYEGAFRVLDEYWPRLMRTRRLYGSDVFRVPRERPIRRVVGTYEQVIAATRELLGDYYGLSWLVALQK